MRAARMYSPERQSLILKRLKVTQIGPKNNVLIYLWPAIRGDQGIEQDVAVSDPLPAAEMPRRQPQRVTGILCTTTGIGAI